MPSTPTVLVLYSPTPRWDLGSSPWNITSNPESAKVPRPNKKDRVDTSSSPLPIPEEGPWVLRHWVKLGVRGGPPRPGWGHGDGGRDPQGKGSMTVSLPV